MNTVTAVILDLDGTLLDTGAKHVTQISRVRIIAYKTASVLIYTRQRFFMNYDALTVAKPVPC